MAKDTKDEETRTMRKRTQGCGDEDKSMRQGHKDIGGQWQKNEDMRTRMRRQYKDTRRQRHKDTRTCHSEFKVIIFII